MTPEEFKNKVEAVLKDEAGDPETAHVETDQLMETVLISLGYEEGIKLIRNSPRWYA